VSSLSKMLSILDMFEGSIPRITAEEVQQRFSLSRATAYRYLKTLTDAGLLARFSSVYVLGSRVIELDYLIRQSDPLLKASELVLAEISAANDCDVQLLSLAGDRIIVTSHVKSKAGLTVSYGRGRVTPPLRGAGAHTILAMLPATRQRALVAPSRGNGPSKADAAEWQKLSRALSEVRKRGYYVSRGELDAETVGIALPIVHPALDAPASIVLIMSRARFALTDEQRVVALLKNAVGRITRGLDDLQVEPAET